MTRNILYLLIFNKVTIFLIIILAFFLFSFNKVNFNSNFHYPNSEKISLISAFKTWDGQHYLFLIEKGYHKNNISNTFYPLFPAGVSLLNLLIKNSTLSGLIISNIFSILSMYYFFLFAKILLKNEQKALVSLLLLLSFPTAFYLSLIYSESLFLFLTSAFFYYLYSRKYFLASIFALFIPISRPIGVLIIFPYFVFWVSSMWKQSRENIKTFLIEFFKTKHTYYLIAPLIGFIAYLIFMQITTGSYFEGFRMESYNVGHWDIANVLNPLLFFVNLFFPESSALHGFTNSIIDRVFFVCYCIFLYFIYKKLDKTMFVYALVMGMVPILGSFMSYTRYVLMVFPIFMVLAKFYDKSKYKLLFYPTLLLFIVIQIIFLIMHSLNYWVA